MCLLSCSWLRAWRVCVTADTSEKSTSSNSGFTLSDVPSSSRWFGLILLPIVSFSADGAVAIVYFIRAALFLKPAPPATIAKARAIDLSIQFTLFWMPFLVLLSWWTDRPLTLLFGERLPFFDLGGEGLER